jgi:hypothetical protein
VRARLTSTLFLVGALTLAAGRAWADPPPAQLWLAPGDPSLAEVTRSGLERALQARGRRLREVTSARAEEPRLAPELKRALEAYAALRLDEALAALRALSASAEKLGGADLDTHQLGELYLHLALCAQELGQNDAAWDAFVRSARIDPTRALDPARVPPRATTIHRRAQQELGQLTPVELELRLPQGARARIDGDEGHASGPVGRKLVPGPHFVRVDAPGFEDFRGMVTLNSRSEVFAPNLRTLEAPAIADEGEALSARLERAGDGWRLSLRGRQAGVTLEASSPVRAQSAEAVAARLVERVMGAPPPRRVPVYKKWWLWTVVGVAAAAGVAIAVPVALSQRGGVAPGSAGGALEPLR